jgi:glucose-6-phosphate isomerase
MEKPEIRYLYDMKNVLYDQTWLKTAKNFGVYYIYRSVKTQDGLRYDITEIAPKMLGKEFPKTKGHIHTKNFSELLNVLEGQAFYLFQKSKGKNVEDVYVVKAQKGDFIKVPPEYNHLTINPSKKKLKMANWISKKCKNDYSFFEKMQGACYYYTKSGWLKNKNYKKIPKLRFEKPLKEMPKNLDFLK